MLAFLMPHAVRNLPDILLICKRCQTTMTADDASSMYLPTEFGYRIQSM